MKKYFQKIYNETGVKPFTFLNCAVSFIIPLVLFGVIYSMENSQGIENADTMIVLSTIGIIACWGIDIAILYNRFKDVKRIVILFILGLFASFAFMWKLFFWPLIQWGMDMALGATKMQDGNYGGASNQARRAGSNARARGQKTSAFNWFVYDGNLIQDIPGTVDQYTDEEMVDRNPEAWCGTLGRSFTATEDQNARAMGYADAYDAYNRGVNVNDLNK